MLQNGGTKAPPYGYKASPNSNMLVGVDVHGDP